MDWHSRYVLAWRLSNAPRSGSGAGSGGQPLRRGAGESPGPGTAGGVQHRPEPAPAKAGGRQLTSLEFTQVLQDRGVKISRAGKEWYQDNIFVERLWRTVKYEGVYLKACATVLVAKRGLEDYFWFYYGLRGVPRGAWCRRCGVLWKEAFTRRGDRITGRRAGILTYLGPDSVQVSGSASDSPEIPKSPWGL